MKYIVIIPDYMGSCIRDEFEGEIAVESLELPDDIINEINAWHNNYRKIIPLSTKERGQRKEEIEKLDAQGLELAKCLETLIPGGAKVKYFSEGKLKYMRVN